MSDCIFCKIAEKKIPAAAVFEDDEIFAFNDVNPQAPVHILIIPKKHIPSVMDLKDKDRELIGKIHLVAQALAVKEKVSETGFRLIVNNGPDAGQAVGHLHFHLLGKRKLGWPPG
ncbi:MAG: histidine triad nucleotide-binding protein [Elusimicrobia bacterium]|nr:histidine triad nucleotide-binding protein [Elusimicrobiota bacterium]MBU2615287.1 histidine triad nucleotide-binding protein [Elusimicrobiota bacterium]